MTTPPPSRVLVVKLSSLGDLFHALPTVRVIKQQFGCPIDWVVQREYADLVGCFPDVDRVIPFDRRGGLGALPLFVRRLRGVAYDLVLDLQGLLKSAMVSRVARGGRRIGPSFQREGARGLYHAVAGKRDKSRHAVAECLDTARYLGIPVPAVPLFPLAFPPAVPAAPPPRVAMVPVSRWVTKNWPADRFAAVARRLVEERSASVFLVGGPGDREICARIATDAGVSVDDRSGRTSLVEMGGLLAAMDLVVCVDSGPMHMAAALGVPVVAIFGPTDPLRTGPYGDGHRVLQADGDCRPCFSRDCRLGTARCLAGVSVQDVMDAALAVLG
jgi:heptosyltransferase-1